MPVIIIVNRSFIDIKCRAKNFLLICENQLKIVNDKIIEFKTQFAGKDMQDYIAMVLIWYATQQSSETKEKIEEDDLVDSLALIEKSIDKVLEN